MPTSSEELRGVALKVPTSVFNRLAAEAHARSLREGRVLGVATVIREAVADAFAFSPEDDAALRGDRRKARTSHSLHSIHPIRHRRPPKAGSRGNADLAGGATGCNAIGAEA